MCLPSFDKTRSKTLTLEYRINRGENNWGGGSKWFDITIIGGLSNQGVGCLDKLKIVAFLAKHVSLFIYLCELTHLPINSGSFECTS